MKRRFRTYFITNHLVSVNDTRAISANEPLLIHFRQLQVQIPSSQTLPIISP